MVRHLEAQILEPPFISAVSRPTAAPHRSWQGITIDTKSSGVARAGCLLIQLGQALVSCLKPHGSSSIIRFCGCDASLSNLARGARHFVVHEAFEMTAVRATFSTLWLTAVNDRRVDKSLPPARRDDDFFFAPPAICLPGRPWSERAGAFDHDIAPCAPIRIFSGSRCGPALIAIAVDDHRSPSTLNLARETSVRPCHSGQVPLGLRVAQVVDADDLPVLLLPLSYNARVRMLRPSAARYPLMPTFTPLTTSL